MKNRPISRFKRTPISIALLATSGALYAQTEAPSAPAPAAPTEQQRPEQIQRVEVTGSLIKRAVDEGALPVTSIRATELESRGHTEMKDFMLELPQANSLGTNPGTAGPMTNLRGFGPMRTLTLLDGKRLAKEPLTNQYTSVNVIPRMAQERTEILRDGASSAYGSDAISGVQAFYTKKTFEGVRVKLEALVPERSGGGGQNTLGLISGFGNLSNDGWNAYVAVDAQQRKALPRNARPQLLDGLASMGIALVPGGSTAGVGGAALPGSSASGATGLGAAFPANFQVVTNPLTTQTLGPALNLAAGTCAPPYSAPYTIRLGTQNVWQSVCWYDQDDGFGAWSNKSNVYNVFTKGSLKLSGDHLLTVQGNFNSSLIVANSGGTGAPTSFSGGGASAANTVNLRMDSSHPYYPGGGKVPLPVGFATPLNNQPIELRWAIADQGPRENEDTQRNNRIVMNLEGELFSWSYQTALNYGWADRTVRAGNGQYNLLGLGDSTHAGGALQIINNRPVLYLNQAINPFGPQDVAGQNALNAASIEGATKRLNRSNNLSLDLTVSKPLFNLGGGDAILAAGGEVRRDGWEAVGFAAYDPFPKELQTTLSRVQGLEIINVANPDGSSRSGSSLTNKISRNIYSLFGEMEVPLTKELSVTGALRWDKYDDLKLNTTNPKLAIRWQPVRSLVIRGSANTGFRAPALPEVNTKETESAALANNPSATVPGATGYNDPKYCPGGAVVDSLPAGTTRANFCGRTGLSQITKRPGLTIKPEKSDSFTLGFALEPVKNISVSVDYWQTKIKDVIATYNQTWLDNNASSYADKYLRDANGVLNSLAIDNSPTNIGGLRASGFDVSLNASQRVDDLGRFSFGLDVAYLTKWEGNDPRYKNGEWQSALATFNDALPANPNAGISNATRGLNNRWRHTASFGWSMGDYKVQLSNRYQSKLRDLNPGSALNASALAAGSVGARDVRPYSQWNLTTDWQVTKNIKLGLAINNLADALPPQTNHTAYRGYLTSTADLLGRAYRVSADVSF